MGASGEVEHCIPSASALVLSSGPQLLHVEEMKDPFYRLHSPPATYHQLLISIQVSGCRFYLITVECAGLQCLPQGVGNALMCVTLTGKSFDLHPPVLHSPREIMKLVNI